MKWGKEGLSAQSVTAGESLLCFHGSSEAVTSLFWSAAAVEERKKEGEEEEERLK